MYSLEYPHCFMYQHRTILNLLALEMSVIQLLELLYCPRGLGQSSFFSPLHEFEDVLEVNIKSCRPGCEVMNTVLDWTPYYLMHSLLSHALD